MTRPGSVLVLLKASAVLDALTANEEMSAADIAEAIDEPKTTIYRLLATLESVGMVEAGARRSTYRLGLRFLALGDAVVSRFDQRRAALPVMEDLAQRLGDTVFLSVRDGMQAVCIERVPGRLVSSMVFTPGGTLPLHLGAGPRALLAFAPREDWDDYLAQVDLNGLTDRSPTTPADIRRLLETTRESGISVSDDDLALGMAALAAPVYNRLGQVAAALSIGGPTPAILGEGQAIRRDALVTAAAAVSRLLGYTDGN